MKALKTLSLITKVAAIAASLHPITWVDPKTALIIFLVASATKDIATRLGDVLDDGKQNQSFPKE